MLAAGTGTPELLSPAEVPDVAPPSNAESKAVLKSPPDTNDPAPARAAPWAASLPIEAPPIPGRREEAAAPVNCPAKYESGFAEGELVHPKCVVLFTHEILLLFDLEVHSGFFERRVGN